MVKTDWIMFGYFIQLALYNILIGVCYTGLFISVYANDTFSWTLAIGAWFSSAVSVWLAYKLKKRIQYVAEEEQLKYISEKLREVKKK
jgi:uncharacterized membrane protein